MGKIIRLNTHLANLIAAGEVVEKPSSVVKELVENSIDAKAKTITIHLADCGIKSINVIDDGVGMSSEDALEAFGRHSTSKIKTEYDLARIHTLGFRGEAIPSIASVSQMRILTNDGSGGFEVVYKAGSFISSTLKATNKGTNILVENLFFNTPARLKYLKSLSSELGSIVYLVGRIALSYPNIAFTLTNNKKEVLKTAGNNDLVRLFGDLYGLNTAKSLIFHEFNGYGYKFKFVLVKPEISRASRSEITIITNGRFVKNTPLANAIIEGYHTYLPIGRYPICCLYLDIDPLLIDVNVHPSKQIIKISNETQLAGILTNATKEALAKVNHVVEIKEVAEKPISYQKETIFSIEQNKPIIEEEKTTYKKEEIKEEIKEEKKDEGFPYFEYIGQLHGTYLLFQNEEGLFLIDQHAAAERIRYEYYYELLGKKDNITIPLLVPYNIEFTKEEMIYLEDNLDNFKEEGFVLEQSSPNSYFLREVPSWANFDSVEETIRRILIIMINDRKVNISKIRDRVAKEISCKSSIKANKALSTLEVDTLIQKLKNCQNPYQCPHGRPVTIRISSYEIEKMFKRVM